jgi:hypothetical protein
MECVTEYQALLVKKQALLVAKQELEANCTVVQSNRESLQILLTNAEGDQRIILGILLSLLLASLIVNLCCCVFCLRQRSARKRKDVKEPMDTYAI